MPARNRIKEYKPNCYYHIYNRGVEKREIFLDKQDMAVFLAYLKEYLSPKDMAYLEMALSDPSSSASEKANAIKQIRLNNFSTEVVLLAYCLMPNHFHLLVKQNLERSIEKLMRSLSTRYVQYFNHRHQQRVGGLFQDIYKAVEVRSEEQLLQLSRYIHRTPASKGSTLKDRPEPSSYVNYLGEIRQEWVKSGEILAYFAKSGTNSYESFVEDEDFDEQMLHKVKDLTLEDDP